MRISLKTRLHSTKLSSTRFREMEDCVDRKTFYDKLETLKAGKSKLTVYLSDSLHHNAKNYLEKLQQGKEDETRAELTKSEISTIKRKRWTLKDENIVTGDNRIVVPKSKLHEVLCECHSSTAHRGRDKTNTYVKGIYSEIPQQVVSLFTSLCKLHAQQRSITDHKKQAITKPISAETFMSHVEVDLIDFRNVKCSCTNPHQWVLHVTDHHTKYSWLFALHNKTAEEVLAKLQELFWHFGFPQTLHTDNGKEFKNKLIQEFCQKHGIKQVHGAPRKPQTQGLVERNNRTVKENLTNILKENQAELTTWCSRLGEAAYKKNITIHRAVKETPYRLVFGIDPKKENKENPTQEEQEEDQVSEMENENGQIKRKTAPTSEAESRKRIRIEANSHQTEYNEKMKKSRQKAQTLNIGDYVSIKIDPVDKTPFHPNVLMGKIVAFENEYAKVACKFGLISTLISPARLVKCQATNMQICKDKEITFTKACKMAIDQ